MADAKDPKETRQLTGEKSNVGLVERTKETAVSLKDRALEEAKDYKDPQQTQLWKSIFRVSHERSDPRNRSLAILSNVFLHLHPAKINRDAVRYQYTWGMGGITFYLFIVLTFTGVLLMFYTIRARSLLSATFFISSTTFPSASCCATCIAG